jgi:hypothetical protein
MKFYAQYYGQKIIHTSLSPHPDIRQTIDADKFRIPHQILNSRLELKSISDISDEEAIELIRLGSDVHKKCIITRKEKSGISFSSEYDYSKRRRNHGYFLNYLSCHAMNTHQIDYLRSKGYAVPFMECSIDDLIKSDYIYLKQQQ